MRLIYKRFFSFYETKMEELKSRLEEKNRQIEKKTQVTFQASQDKSRYVSEINEMKEHMEIKDRKINVLQRKVKDFFLLNNSQTLFGHFLFQKY